MSTDLDALTKELNVVFNEYGVTSLKYRQLLDKIIKYRIIII